MSHREGQADWESLAADPDVEQDLGYDLDEWEAIEARTAESDCLMFLPTDEELLREDAFVVAATGDVCNLLDHR
jgi:hypothetical protein